MKYKMTAFLSVITCFVLFTHQVAAQPALIPEPVSMTQKEGAYQIRNKIIISSENTTVAVKKIAELLVDKLSSTGLAATFTVGMQQQSDIKFVINKVANNTIGKEGYLLSVTEKEGVTINANEPAGLFYGMQTLLQLLPPEIESKSVIQNVSWQIPQIGRASCRERVYSSV